jgi:hypothetical protein
MTIQLAQIHREWCKQVSVDHLVFCLDAELIWQNLEAWQAAQAAIRDIEPHPNQPPSSAAHPAPAKLFDHGHLSPEAGSASPTSATTARPDAEDSPLDLTGLRHEIDRVEAANVPLPLPQDDHETDQAGSSSGGAFTSPLGPL